MRFHLGAPPESPDFTPDNSWKEMRGPGLILTNLYALPLGFIVCAIVVMGWLWLTPVTKSPFFSTPLMLGSMLLLFPVHEFIHGLAHPQFGMSRKTVLGLWPARQLFYASYEGERSRNRLIVALAMPLLVISIVPLLVSALIGQASLTIAFISSLNVIAASVDILGIFGLLFNMPRATVIRIHGMKAYWKLCEKTSVN